MEVEKLALPGAFLLRPRPIPDARGFFARVFCETELQAHGLITRITQQSISFNHRRGTLRGMHYQAEPHPETKLVRCTRGAIHDVIVDLRPRSSTRFRWIAVELSAENQATLYIPAGFAHGFQTLVDNTEVFYQMDVPFVAGLGRGIRWDDPELAIPWPVDEKIISDRDRELPLLSDLR